MITEHKKGVIEFIETVYMDEMDDLVCFPVAGYSKFLILIQGIEFLGACQDNHPFEKEGLSKKRFRKGMVLMGEKYKKYLDEGDDVWFYGDFRCPMVHQFKHDQSKITLATREGVDHKEVHLTKNEKGQLYVVLEEFYADIKQAAQTLVEQIQEGEYSVEKLSEPYLTIHKIQELSFTTT